MFLLKEKEGMREMLSWDLWWRAKCFSGRILSMVSQVHCYEMKMMN